MIDVKVKRSRDAGKLRVKKIKSEKTTNKKHIHTGEVARCTSGLQDGSIPWPGAFLSPVGIFPLCLCEFSPGTSG